MMKSKRRMATGLLALGLLLIAGLLAGCDMPENAQGVPAQIEELQSGEAPDQDETLADALAEADPSATPDPNATATPEAEETPEGPELPEDEQTEEEEVADRGVYCQASGDREHPTGAALADAFDVEYDEIMTLFCEEGFGFGEIRTAYGLAGLEEADVDIDAIVAMREEGMGWGQIFQELGIKPGNSGKGDDDEEAETAEDGEDQDRPGNAPSNSNAGGNGNNGNNGNGPPPHSNAGGNGNGNGRGNDDDGG